MFYVKKMDDVYVAKHFRNLKIPQYLEELHDFEPTLDALYAWKNHHERLREIVLPAITKKQDDEFLAKLVPMPSASAEDAPYNSPNVFFTPSKRRRISITCDDDNIDDDEDSDIDQDV